MLAADYVARAQYISDISTAIGFSQTKIN